ncbi:MULTISPECIES: hypothetical protein [Thermomonosporaceae]|uniref:hypothetical protein n=1 Tax=Thermomonosporaceae TaxID=2012 RepID=UPI00255A9961|nr:MULTISPECIES: hypothetical protein [Thermomonosporaceae]MDL4770777.1 hypothetical protein [Actinomadura xylanilytica]
MPNPADDRPEQVNTALDKLRDRASLTDEELRALQTHIDELESRISTSSHHHDLHAVED